MNAEGCLEYITDALPLPPLPSLSSHCEDTAHARFFVQPALYITVLLYLPASQHCINNKAICTILAIIHPHPDISTIICQFTSTGYKRDITPYVSPSTSVYESRP